MFTQRFYELLFIGKSVCDAFESAQNDVELEFSKLESDIFKIFVKEEKNEL